MPRVQIYLKHNAIDEIHGLVEEDIQAGANPAEASFSSKACMLLELGLRVYNLRRSEHAGSGRDEYDRVMMAGVLEAKYLAQNLTKMVSTMNGIDSSETKERVKKLIQNDMEQFFPSTDEE